MSRREAVSVSNARQAWGDPPPVWVMALAEACDRTSQKAVGQRIGYSAGAISTVLSAKYGGNMTKFEQAVRGGLMAEKVDCPVLGEIPTNNCLTHQSSRFSTASPQAARLSRTCPKCANRHQGGNDAE